MMTPEQIAVVQATVPVLEVHGEDITRHFYRRMFTHHPELKNIFNQGHQASGNQQRALAGAVYAYARNIANPGVLEAALTRIAHKHVSLGIEPAQYSIVGTHLLASIREVLGEAATDEILDAWKAAYGQLADLLIAQEASLYEANDAVPGSWRGWRKLKVERKVRESSEITSFYLVASDGSALPTFRPGQYVSVKRHIPGLELEQPRQYSLSDAPHGRWLRISVKREDGDAAAQRPAGWVSSELHANLNEGDELHVSAPYGDFYLDESRDTPVVMISGGVGLTPMMSMLNALVWQGSRRRVLFVHACRDAQVHAMKTRLNRIVEECPQVTRAVFYETVTPQDVRGRDHDFAGLVDLDALGEALLMPQADYYLCGPLPFMQAQRDGLLARGVDAERIHWEVFGSGN
ncbi:MAG: NO-inducible flavohemoprotein [Burkholderiales bacterium]|nr:NO-inducible flavohemoprotein [Burkholderiales bacterium]